MTAVDGFANIAVDGLIQTFEIFFTGTTTPTRPTFVIFFTCLVTRLRRGLIHRGGP